MASREEVALLNAARAGIATAQIALAKRYLSGSSGLPQNVATGLYWLERAAQQEMPEAWSLIGSHVPYDVAVRAPDRQAVCHWYERAFDSGNIQAGLVLAKLVFTAGASPQTPALRSKAWQALEYAAEQGIPDAQWLLAEQLAQNDGITVRRDEVEVRSDLNPATPTRYLDWARRAAANGQLQAHRLLADHAWQHADERMYLHWAIPLAHALIAGAPNSASATDQLRSNDIVLLSRCVRALFHSGDINNTAIAKFAEAAARAGDKWAQLYLGLWLAKMDEEGRRIAGSGRLVNYRKALQWLTLAGQQGVASAWYVAARIHFNPHVASRNTADAEHYLVRAAEGGHRGAQLEWANRLWRKRATVSGNDLQAVYWLQQAAAQGCPQAAAALGKCASPSQCADWAARALRAAHVKLDPLMAARLKVAACFGLTEREAMLINIAAADRGHCLDINVAERDGRGKRRLILIQTATERRLLDEVKLVFQGIDCGPEGPEGNYRQRLYRLRRLGEAVTVGSPRARCMQHEVDGVPLRRARTRGGFLQPVFGIA